MPPELPVPPKPAVATQKQDKRHWLVVSAIFFCTLGGFGGGWLAGEVRGGGLPDTTNSQANQRIVSSEGEVIADVAEQVSPSVVSIVVNATSTTAFGQAARSESAGTGIIVKDDGLVLTNKHVVTANATKITITTSDGQEYSDVSIVGRDPLNDIAYLKINGGKNLKAARLGDSDKLRVGDKVVAIGNALGEFSNSVTAGIISAKGRPVSAGSGDGEEAEQLQNLIQTDAAINQGNSGGPLVNISGEVIGMNTALAGDAQNIGFAIPVNDIKPGLETVSATGKFERPYLGVRFTTLNKQVAEELKLPVNEGAYINGSDTQAGVIADSPADKAGLQEGDIITKIDDTEVTQSNQLTNILARKRVGDQIKVTYLREGKPKTVTATLVAAPSS